MYAFCHIGDKAVPVGVCIISTQAKSTANFKRDDLSVYNGQPNAILKELMIISLVRLLLHEYDDLLAKF